MSIVKDILSNLGIAALSAMQQQACDTFHETGRYVLLSPTGSGKTLAYLLPLCRDIDKDSEALQAVVIVPSRELALQSHDVLARMKCGVCISPSDQPADYYGMIYNLSFIINEVEHSEVV